MSWPTSSLETVTLIDTPGLASINDENSRRTREFLEADADRPSDADAVIYLIRHAHRTDIAFLDAFMDRSVTAASPVNAVAVLSRADEIGGGRLDAMESAARIAGRYESDPQLTRPVRGRRADGRPARRDRADAARGRGGVAARARQHRRRNSRRMLLSADHFCEISSSDLTVEIARDLLARLGMFGVRLAVREIKAGRAPPQPRSAPSSCSSPVSSSCASCSPATSGRGRGCCRRARRSRRCAPSPAN